jgi:hypothetical protein
MLVEHLLSSFFLIFCLISSLNVKSLGFFSVIALFLAKSGGCERDRNGENIDVDVAVFL